MLLTNQTEFLVIRDAERTLLRTADEVTRLVAEGYTAANAPAATRKFLDAAARLDRYVVEVRALAARGHMPPETSDLLVLRRPSCRGVFGRRGGESG